MDKYHIDSHKLMYHPDRVQPWLKGETVYPIYMEISPSGQCNHRCTFCALDYMEYEKRFLDTAQLKVTVSELATLGVKSIMYAGEGEPLLHPYIADIVQHTKNRGIDVAMTSNGVEFGKMMSRLVLPHLKWIKFSVNAGSNGLYKDIHRTNPSDFDKVIFNIEHACKLRKDENLNCAIGVQSILLPENEHEMLLLAETVKDCGADYFVIKPYSQHTMSKTNRYEKIKYTDLRNLRSILLDSDLNDDGFEVIYRSHTINKWNKKQKEYQKCYGLPFWSYIDAGGNVWGCSAHLGRETFNFNYGNIYEESFEDIWNGEKRAKNLKWVQNTMNCGNCRVNCRMDECNRYLWELRNPNDHVNFI